MARGGLASTERNAQFTSSQSPFPPVDEDPKPGQNDLNEQNEYDPDPEALLKQMQSTNRDFTPGVRRPISMRGSLNMVVRKNEQKNIIQGNKVSFRRIFVLLIHSFVLFRKYSRS